MNLPEEVGKYRIIGFLGRGQFGEVHHVLDRALGVERAIKIISTDRPERLVEALSEAQFLEKCRHKHIVDVKEANIWRIGEQSAACIVMEYLSRGSIQSLVESGFLSVRTGSQLVSEALLGLEHAHNQGVIHRDIKPGNILLSDNGYAKLSDFGLALDYRAEIPGFTGYIAHLAPEVLAFNTQDKLSDIYAMGVTLYRLVNNLITLEHDYNQEELLDAINRRIFPSRSYQPHVPKRVAAIVNSAIHPDQTKRYSEAQDFRQALERLKFWVDWQRLGAREWVGVDDTGNHYAATLLPKNTGWDLVCRVNGRRHRSNCAHFSAEKDAVDALFKTIRDTTLKPS